MKGDRLYNKAMRQAADENADLNSVFQLLSKAQQQGHSGATYALATWYLHGKFVEQHFGKACQLLQQAADANVADACFDLAICYEQGKGVRISLKDAFFNYTKASLLGDRQAIYEVGRCYYYGIGTGKNTNLAELWLDMAEHYGVTY